MHPTDVRAVLPPLIRAAGVGHTARQAKIATPSLSQWLAGDNSIGPAKLDEIAQLFGYRAFTAVAKISKKSRK